MYYSKPVYLIIGLIFCCSGFLAAQEISATITDETDAPVAYATVYLSATKTGTISDGQGRFTFNLGEVADSSRVSISCIGYTSHLLTVAELKALGDQPIVINAANYVLAATEVTAAAIKMKQKKLGLKGMLNATYGISTQYNSRREHGTIMRPDGLCRLDEVTLKVREMDADSILLDINIYDFQFSRVGEPLIRERIFLSLSKDQVGKDISVSVVDQGIRTDKPFLVAIRVLNVVGSSGSFKFAAKTGKDRGQERVPGGRWLGSTMTPALYTKVSYPK